MDIPQEFQKPFRKKPQGNVSNNKTISNLGQAVTFNHDDIKKACKDAAKSAYDAGETNDPEKYSQEMLETLIKALNKRKKQGY